MLDDDELVLDGSGRQSPGRPGRNNRARELPAEATNILKQWLFSPEHFNNPYPTHDETTALAARTCLERTQVKNWFVNARRRIWRKARDKGHATLAGNRGHMRFSFGLAAPPFPFAHAAPPFPTGMLHASHPHHAAFVQGTPPPSFVPHGSASLQQLLAQNMSPAGASMPPFVAMPHSSRRPGVAMGALPMHADPAAPSDSPAAPAGEDAEAAAALPSPGLGAPPPTTREPSHGSVEPESTPVILSPRREPSPSAAVHIAEHTPSPPTTTGTCRSHSSSVGDARSASPSSAAPAAVIASAESSVAKATPRKRNGRGRQREPGQPSWARYTPIEDSIIRQWVDKYHWKSPKGVKLWKELSQQWSEVAPNLPARPWQSLRDRYLRLIDERKKKKPRRSAGAQAQRRRNSPSPAALPPGSADLSRRRPSEQGAVASALPRTVEVNPQELPPPPAVIKVDSDATSVGSGGGAAAADDAPVAPHMATTSLPSDIAVVVGDGATCGACGSKTSPAEVLLLPCRHSVHADCFCKHNRHFLDVLLGDAPPGRDLECPVCAARVDDVAALVSSRGSPSGAASAAVMLERVGIGTRALMEVMPENVDGAQADELTDYEQDLLDIWRVRMMKKACASTLQDVSAAALKADKAGALSSSKSKMLDETMFGFDDRFRKIYKMAREISEQNAKLKGRSLGGYRSVASKPPPRQQLETSMHVYLSLIEVFTSTILQIRQLVAAPPSA